MVSQRLTTISVIIGIFVGIIGTLIIILNYFQITPPFYPPYIDKEAPFIVSIDPPFIEEGQYQDYNGFPKQIPIKFTLTLNPNKNITYFELNENNVIVDRENKTSQTQSAGSIIWTKKADYSHIFYKNSYTFSSSDSYEAEGWLYGCQNCFMGENHPYIFIFTFSYVENGGSKKTYTSNIRLPVT